MSTGGFHCATGAVLENQRLAPDIYRLRFHAPSLAATARPGQFLMLRVPGRTDPLLGRAFAVYETDPAAGAVEIVHLVVGKMTHLLARLTPGDEVEWWGPLGRPFPDYAGVDHLVAVAGGIGQTPFLTLLQRALGRKGYGGDAVRREVNRASVYYGARTAAAFAGLDAFAATGAEVHLATDDGSAGHSGFVTEKLEADFVAGRHGPAPRWVGCGPEPMLHALANLAQRLGVPCDVSLETPMACGVGICFSCVVKVKEASPAGWDYRRVCLEGPIFDAAKLHWD